MNILFVSAGLMPKRAGGLPAYVAECRDELNRRGHSVVYLDTNCQDDSRQPRIELICNSPTEYSFFNSGASLPFGGPMPAPLSDIRASRRAGQRFLEFIERVNPDIIHFQELACVPLQLVSILRASGRKLLFTAQDYFALCPTIQLFRHDQRLCLLKAHELECHQCVRKWPFAQLTPFSSRAERRVRKLRWGRRVGQALLRRIGPWCDRMLAPLVFSSEAYRSRRVKALDHLRSFHLVLCISKLQRDLMAEISGCPSLFRQVYPSRATYGEARRPVVASRSSNAIRFVGLNINQATKGKELLLSEFSALRADLGNVELHLYGGEGADASGVFYHGSYGGAELDAILSQMDVGIVPSLWPEAYGYVGPEMLSRGLPLIASSAGAMREYVVAGHNGLLFNPAEPGSLKQAMKSLAVDSDLLNKLKSNAPRCGQGIVIFSSHIDEMEAIYREILAIPPNGAAQGESN